MRRLLLPLIPSVFLMLLAVMFGGFALAPVFPRAEWDVVAISQGVNTGVLIADVTRGLVQPLTPQGMIGYAPRWSPDGNHVAFVRSVQDNDSPYALRVYVMDRFGRDARQISLTGAQAWSPHWSPDGTRLAYSGAFGIDSPDISVYIVGLDGNPTPDIQVTIPVNRSTHVQTWGKDATSLVVLQLTTAGDAQDLEWGLYTLNIADNEYTRLRQGFTLMNYSPDGRFAALYHSHYDQGIQLYEFETEITEPVTGFGSSPAWSADSQRLLFFNNYESKLEMLDVRSHEVQDYPFTLPIETTLTNNLNLAWKP